MSNSHVTTTFAQGTLIAGKYRLLNHLGEGAMGVVWAARNEHTSGQVALKLIHGRGPELRLRLLREAQACCQIRHKNVIQIHDVGQADNGDPFLVMELLSGETLADLLARKRRLNQREASVIGRDAARALAAAHEKGIVHRDLKPDNIFLHNQPGEDARVVKVLDFGVSKNLLLADGIRTMLGGPIGSPSYMSPEQASGGGDIDARSDIWALGVLLFEMLTGERPFVGDTHELIEAILHGEIPLASRRVRGIEPGLDRLIAGCLTRDREQRLWPITDIVRGLEPFVENPPRSSVPTLTALWGTPPASTRSPPASARGPAPLPDLGAEQDAATRELDAETQTTGGGQERLPRALLPRLSPQIPHDSTVRMFSAAPTPAAPISISAPVITSTEVLPPPPRAAVSDAGLPPSLSAPWSEPAPLVEELPPPRRERRVVARVLVAILVASVVMGLALTESKPPSVPVVPLALPATTERGVTGESAPASPPVVAEKPAITQAALPDAGAEKPPPAPTSKKESVTRPSPRLLAPKPRVKCGRFVKTDCDPTP